VAGLSAAAKNMDDPDLKIHLIIETYGAKNDVGKQTIRIGFGSKIWVSG